MARIRNPIRFSDHFGFDSTLLTAAGALNPTLNVDIGLFIDQIYLNLNATANPNLRLMDSY